MIGDNKQGYLYGSVKICKTNNPLRSIISQLPTPLYELIKTINLLITQYLHNKFNIKSTQESIKILQTQKPNNGILTSLDVENLFTKLPDNETIDIIIDNIYKAHPYHLL